MVSTRDGRGEFELDCPCCGTRLKIDASLGKVVWHGQPSRKTAAPDIGQSAQLLENEKARREAIFRRSAEDEKSKSELLQKKFEEALKRSKGEPVERPFHEIDLD